MKTAAFALLATLWVQPAPAIEYRTIHDVTGRPIFEARFFDMGDGPFAEDDGEIEEPFWPWRPGLQEQIASGLAYWAEVLQPMGPGGSPLVVNIGTDDEPDNAFGDSPLANGGAGPKTLYQHWFQGLPIAQGDLSLGAHGVFGLGDAAYRDSPLMQISTSDTDDLFSTTVHEIAHGLGVDSKAEDIDGAYMPYFGPVLAGWAPLLVDDNGNRVRPNQVILCEGCNNAYDPSAFDVRRDEGMLVGPHIIDALEGGLPGVPVKMRYEVGDYSAVDDNNMSHIELRNSMMSHQNYRNYKVFMEAELAVLQDLGYTIDRRNFFGRSVYGSGLDMVNERGFFARDAQGRHYLSGVYNQATLGLGLHVYGSDNRIRQVADLLSAGAGGAGIRVDGVGNTVIIDPGVRVHANGLNGQGIMFTYGKDHVLVHRGDVQALGTNGVGLRFDFGINGLGAAIEERGSYIRTLSGSPAALLPELQGPLVRQADITGSVAGSEAAIHISGNAYVGGINLMRGARLSGDIVSHYSQVDDADKPRLTTITFGRQADAQGRATHEADAGFRLAYAGNIRGQDNLVLSFMGGETRLNGQHALQAATVHAGASLSGNSVFDLAPGGVFVNQGTLAPGNSIGHMSIGGDYRQDASGRLTAEFDQGGAHDVLTVSGTAELAGTLELAPMAGWYPSDWAVQTGSVVEAAALSGDFDTVAFAARSPTLGFDATALGGQRYALQASRADDAYSRYGRDANTGAAGRALVQLAAGGPAQVQPFFQALDFSAPDGSEVGRTLDLLTPAAYSAGLAATLQRERDLLDTAAAGFGQSLRTEGPEWRGFATAFGGQGRQDARDTLVGYDADTYGLIVGGGRRLSAQPDTAVAVHLDISEQSVELDAPQWGKGRSSAFGLGAQLLYRPDAQAGPYAHGGLRIGVEQASMDRNVAVGGYYAKHSADWTGHSASAQAGAGYRWKLGPQWSAGPFMSMSYAIVSRPAIDESGGATRLSLDSQRMDALRSSLGLGANFVLSSSGDSAVSAHAKVSWDHEWLDRDVTQTARYTAWPAAAFDTSNAILPRDSMALRAGLAWRHHERFSLGVDLGGRLGGGYQSVEGQVSARWVF